MRKVHAYLFVVVLVIIVCLVFMAAVVNPTVANYAQAELEALTVKAVNIGVGQVVTADTYMDFSDIRRNDQGVITSINTNVVQMNKAAAAIAAASQQSLDTIAAGGLPVPVGTFSGMPLLVGKGMPVRLNIKLAGSVNCRFDSTFTSAGINQTHHKIILSVDTIVSLVLPLYTKRTAVSVQVLFSDSIIVGDVPEFYFTGGH